MDAISNSTQVAHHVTHIQELDYSKTAFDTLLLRYSARKREQCKSKLHRIIDRASMHRHNIIQHLRGTFGARMRPDNCNALRKTWPCIS